MQITKIVMIGRLLGTDRIITHYQSVPLGMTLADNDAIVNSFCGAYDLLELKVTWKEI